MVTPRYSVNFSFLYHFQCVCSVTYFAYWTGAEDETNEFFFDEVYANLSIIGNDKQVTEWRNDLMNTVAWASKRSVTAWLDMLYRQYGPHLLRYEQCILKTSMYLAQFQILPISNSTIALSGCDYCSRWVSKMTSCLFISFCFVSVWLMLKLIICNRDRIMNHDSQ